MASVGPALLIFLLTTVATVAAAGGYLAAVRRRGTAREVFLLGFGCGWLASRLLRGRRRLQRALAVAAWRAQRTGRWGQVRGVAEVLITSAVSRGAAVAPRSRPQPPSRRRPADRAGRDRAGRPGQDEKSAAGWVAATRSGVQRSLPVAKYLLTQRS